NPRRIAHRRTVQGRTEMKMSRDELGWNFRAAQFASHESGAGIVPDRVLDIDDRRHEREEAQVWFNHCKQRANPAAVTRSENSEFAAAALTQSLHELADFHHTLTQTFGVSNQICRYRQLAIPVTARNSRVMIRQMNKACVPTKLVETRGPTSITDVRRRHQSVEHEERWRGFSLCSRKKIGAREVVLLKRGLNRRAP